MAVSLRNRLGVLVAVGALLVTLAATTTIAVARWHEEGAGLADTVELAAFHLSETTNPAAPTVSMPGHVAAYAVVFDEQANVLGSTGNVPSELADTLLLDLWGETTDQDVAVTYPYGDRSVASGVPCVDQRLCDSVVVGAEQESLAAYLVRRSPWLLLPALLAAAVALAATRWLVGRSLRPVDEMRRQLEAITAHDLTRRVDTPHTGDELERLGVALNDTVGRLGDAVAANERFVADAAHELRSPIAGVRAALEVEASRRPGDLLDAGVDELDRASRLVDDLLVLSRRQAGTLGRRDVDLDDVVAAALSVARHRFPGTTIEAHVEPVRVVGDPDALRRVVTNLVENACVYGDGRVAVTLVDTESGAVLRVDDDGPGVPPESRDVIFERFARLDESRARATGGSGLGLAIVHDLVAAHGGAVTVGDAELGGARFEVTLPRSGVGDGQSPS